MTESTSPFRLGAITYLFLGVAVARASLSTHAWAKADGQYASGDGDNGLQLEQVWKNGASRFASIKDECPKHTLGVLARHQLSKPTRQWS